MGVTSHITFWPMGDVKKNASYPPNWDEPSDLLQKQYCSNLLPSPPLAWVKGTVHSLCVCVLQQLSQNLKLQNFNLRQKVVFNKTGRFLQASVA